MRSPRLSRPGVPLTLLALLVLALGGAPAHTPVALAQDGPDFTVQPPRATDLPATPGAVAGTAEGDPPAASVGASAGGAAAAPMLSLPTGAGGAEPTVVERIDLSPANDVKLGGISAATAAGISFGPGEPGLAALSGACEPMIRNSSIFGHQDETSGYYTIYNWTVIKPTVYVETSPYFSYPYSLSMVDGDESVADGRPDRDEDWFGQDFYFPADAQSLLIEFNLYFPGDGDLGFDSFDYAYVELFRLTDDGSLIDEDISTTDLIEGIILKRIDSKDPSEPGYDPSIDQPTDEWYRFTYFFNATNFSSFGELAGQRVALVFDRDGDMLPPLEKPIIDNPQVTVCPTPDQPNKAIEGYVTTDELPPAGAGDTAITTASLALVYRASEGAAPELVRLTYPFESGYYRFRGLPDLPPGGSYQVFYLNSGYEDDPVDPADDRLSYYAGPLVTSFSDVADPDDGYFYGWGGYFDLGDIALAAPVHYAEVAGDVTFSWVTRSFADTGLPDDTGYILCFYDPDTFVEACSSKPIGADPDGVTSTTVSGAALQAATGFPFAYGKTLGWYVVGISDRRGIPETEAFDLAGASRYSQFVTFVQQLAAIPPPPPVEPDPPTTPAAEKAWTLMFYLAGDDADLTTPAGNARGMVDILTNLNQLAESFPEVNIAVQFDFYETTDAPLDADLRGTQRCFFRADVLRLRDACQQLGELNTGSAQVLADFITATRQRYPADHEALIIMGHGNGVTGVAGDRTGDAEGRDDALRPDELEEAYELAGLTSNKLDLIVYYACLMGNFETAAIASRFADYMVASPNIATLVDINREILALAKANPANPRAVAAGIVSTYNTALVRYNGFYGQNLSIAMAAFDLVQAAALAPAVSALGAAVSANLNLEDVGLARFNVQPYDSSAPELWGFTSEGEDALVDLRDLATRLSASANGDLRAAATNLLAQLGAVGGAGGAVIASTTSSGRADLLAGGIHNLTNASGLSIFFPTGIAAGNQISLTRSYLLYYRQTSFRSGAWDELVDATRTGIPSLPRRGRLGGLAGAGGSTLQNLSSPEVFPALSTLPRELPIGPLDKPYQLRMPLLR